SESIAINNFFRFPSLFTSVFEIVTVSVNHLLVGSLYQYPSNKFSITSFVYTVGMINPLFYRSEEHTSELQSRFDLVYRHLLYIIKYNHLPSSIYSQY